MNKKQQTRFDKDILKNLLNKSLTKSEALKALTGESAGTLKQIIGGDPKAHRWFINDNPVSQAEFDRLSDKKLKKGKCSVRVTIAGKPFKDADKDMIE